MPGQGWQSGPHPCCRWLQPPSPSQPPACGSGSTEHRLPCQPTYSSEVSPAILGAETREWGQEETRLKAGAILLQVHEPEELHLGGNTRVKGMHRRKTQRTRAQPHNHTGDLGSSNSGVTALAVHRKHTGFGGRVALGGGHRPLTYVWNLYFLETDDHGAVTDHCALRVGSSDRTLPHIRLRPESPNLRLPPPPHTPLSPPPTPELIRPAPSAAGASPARPPTPTSSDGLTLPSPSAQGPCLCPTGRAWDRHSEPQRLPTWLCLCLKGRHLFILFLMYPMSGTQTLTE